MTPEISHSSRLFAEASRLIPGGVNSPVRAFHSVGREPVFIRSGKGSRLFDADGRHYIDYVGSWGPLLFGHAPEFLVASVSSALQDGTSFGAPTELEVELARLVIEFMPSMEMVRFVSSGSEATAAAVRLARAATGRTKILKCAGCFHGSVDSLLVKAGSGVATLGIPETAGVPPSVASETIVIEYNDADGLNAAFEKYSEQIATFIVEPVAGNMGLVLPEPGYLELARERTRQSGALLIFDEVISGFRLGPGGAQELFGVMPDLTCLGKIIGGGFPVGAYGGRRDLMEMLAPLGPVYQSGTLSGNPIAMTAGIAMLRQIQATPDLYSKLEKAGASLEEGIRAALSEQNVEAQFRRLGSLFTLFFAADPVTNYETAKRCDVEKFKNFFLRMFDSGIYLPPSQFECCFVSAAHTDENIKETVQAVSSALALAAD